MTSVKIAVRCRPFTLDDKLGVKLFKTGEQTATVALLNSDYTTNNFTFTYAWWSAHGYEKRIKPGNEKDVEQCVLVSQEDIYAQCGIDMKGKIFSGQAVVLLAYGLSGSGKSYTLFGPDDASSPVMWHAQTTQLHPSWVSKVQIVSHRKSRTSFYNSRYIFYAFLGHISSPRVRYSERKAK